VWGKANAVKSALTALGVMSDADPVAELRQHIDQLKQQFNGVVAALDREQSITVFAKHLVPNIRSDHEPHQNEDLYSQ
jgi:hypothetical protein